MKLFVFLMLKANKPGDRRNEGQGKEGNKGNERVEGLSEENN